jgi:hypothetical protein
MTAMTLAAYEALKLTYAALAKVKAPPLPVSQALSECATLLAFLQDEDLKAKGDPNAQGPGAVAQAKLASVGLPRGHVAALAQAADGLRYAQALQQSKSLRVTDGAQQGAISAAYALRGDVVAACRWNLRADRVAQSAIDRIMEGEGVVDLIADLNALAVFIQAHASAFAADDTFDPEAKAEACRQAAASTQALIADSSAVDDKKTTTDTRNRAWTHFKKLQKELSEAAQYAFRDDPRTRARFVSAYNKKRYSRAQANAKAQAAPQP